MIKDLFLEGKNRIYGLDLLRAMAIFGVVIYHLPKNPENLFLRAIGHYGFWGVDLFFVLSGFLISQQYFKSLTNNNPRYIRIFYLKRFLRTLPTYFALIFIYTLVNRHLGTVTHLDWKYFLFLQNLDTLKELSHTWSLCVEEHFYLIFPLIAYMITKVKSPNVVCGLFLLVILSGIIIRLAIFIYIRPDLIFSESIHRGYDTYLNNLFYPTYTRLDGLSLGMLTGYLKVYNPKVWTQIIKHHLRNLAIGICLLSISVLVTIKRVTLLPVLFSFPLVSLSFSFFLLATLNNDSIMNRWKIPGITKLSILSYSMYLTHPFAHEISHHIEIYFGLINLSLFSSLLYFLTVGITTIFLFFLVERPSLLARQRILKYLK